MTRLPVESRSIHFHRYTNNLFSALSFSQSLSVFSLFPPSTAPGTAARTRGVSFRRPVSFCWNPSDPLWVRGEISENKDRQGFIVSIECYKCTWRSPCCGLNRGEYECLLRKSTSSHLSLSFANKEVLSFSELTANITLGGRDELR